MGRPMKDELAVLQTYAYVCIMWCEIKVLFFFFLFKRFLLSSQDKNSVRTTVMRTDGGGNRSLCTTADAIGAQHLPCIQ